MIKINTTPDCGNSPKRIFLKEFNIAFAEADIDFLVDRVTDDITWHLVGDKTIQGKSNYLATLQEMNAYKASELTLMSIITHGKEGSVNGELVMDDHKRFAFSDVYLFKNTKGDQIQTIWSYAIELTG